VSLCDMCSNADGSGYADLPALILCEDCERMFNDYRRCHTLGVLVGYQGLPNPPGPAPKLTGFRLGCLSGLFVEGSLAKLERLAGEL